MWGLFETTFAAELPAGVATASFVSRVAAVLVYVVVKIIVA